MGNDRGSSGQDRDGHERQRATSDAPTPHEVPASQANLTQELAHLLAASISQSQIGRPSSGAMTGADLASLASLMANAQATRQPLPRFRDELSSLTYVRPVKEPLAPLRPAEQAAPPARALRPEFEPAHPHDDEPMPIPSTWRQPAVHDEDRSFGKQLGAAALGLAAGLVVVVPAVLWLAGWIGPQRAKGTEPSVAEQGLRDIRTVRTRPMESATFNPNETAAGVPDVPEPRPLTTASMVKAFGDGGQDVEQILVQARKRLESGDVPGAREVLAADATTSGPVLFALAETYDPNMLAAWGSRGVSADVQRARALYGKALDLGFGRAMARLDALK